MGTWLPGWAWVPDFEMFFRGILGELDKKLISPELGGIGRSEHHGLGGDGRDGRRVVRQRHTQTFRKDSHLGQLQ